MPSAALIDFQAALVEVRELRKTDPTRAGAVPKDPAQSRVVGRASVVLLSSHFERYFYALNHELVDAVNSQIGDASLLDEKFRLLHSRGQIDDLGRTQWDNRSVGLGEFVKNEGWLWGGTSGGRLDHSRMLDWMKAPTPMNLNRYFKYWGVSDMFSAVTRKPTRRSELWLELNELVEKRNGIAHGDASVEATPFDIVKYMKSAETFCDRVDRQIARHMAKSVLITPWQ